MQRRYRPNVAAATQSQTIHLGFFLRRIPATGTSTIYSAVIKPALPTLSVNPIPICWLVVARVNITPIDRIPAKITLLFLRLSVTSLPALSFTAKSFLWFNTIKGLNAMIARKERTLLKVNGPTLSIPFCWATKASPQMIAVIKRSILPRLDIIFSLFFADFIG